MPRMDCQAHIVSDHPPPPPGASEWNSLGIESLSNNRRHQQISYEAALQSLVLLRNDDAALPLKPGSAIAVVGPQSTARSGLLSDYAGGQKCYGPCNKHPWSEQEYHLPTTYYRTLVIGQSLSIDQNSDNDEGSLDCQY